MLAVAIEQNICISCVENQLEVSFEKNNLMVFYCKVRGAIGFNAQSQEKLVLFNQKSKKICAF